RKRTHQEEHRQKFQVKAHRLNNDCAANPTKRVTCGLKLGQVTEVPRKRFTSWRTAPAKFRLEVPVDRLDLQFISDLRSGNNHLFACSQVLQRELAGSNLVFTNKK